MELELEKIKPEVRGYVESEILPKYRQLKGHTESHIADVIRRSLKIAKDLDGVNLDMVYGKIVSCADRATDISEPLIRKTL